MGCYVAEGSTIIPDGYYVMMLLFELGQSIVVFYPCLYSPNLTVVVTLTISKGYRDCTFSSVFTPSLRLDIEFGRSTFVVQFV
jgi:hypothetical protein